MSHGCVLNLKKKKKPHGSQDAQSHGCIVKNEKKKPHGRLFCLKNVYMDGSHNIKTHSIAMRDINLFPGPVSARSKKKKKTRSLIVALKN